MARAAEPDDIWTPAAQLALAQRLRAQRDALVEVVENRVHVGVSTPAGWTEWVCEPGGTWSVTCPVHGSRCADPPTTNRAGVIGDAIERWLRTHG